MSKIFSITEGLENMGALRTGGQGSVYKARRMGPIISAVKLLPTPIHSEDNNDKNFRDFQNEVEKLKKVNEDPNPNVVKILDSGLTGSGSLPYIEMEFIEGPDLEDLLKPPHDNIFSIKEVIKLADHLANALAHCHRVGVKHGDVKSNNVKYNIHSGNYVLLDFGLAIMSDEERRTSIRHAGAIEFMAPEQNEGVMLLQTDVYSYGIILYELLAGQVPFPLNDNGETSRNAVMIAHMESPVPDVMELRKKNLPDNWTEARKEQEMRVPQWLLQLIATCLQKDPEARFSDGMALQEAFFNGSIDADISGSTNGYLLALRAENQKQAAQLERYRLLEEGSKKQVHISKPVFIGIIAGLVLIFALGSYGIFTKNDKYPTIKTDTLSRNIVIPVSPKIHPKPKKKSIVSPPSPKDSNRFAGIPRDTINLKKAGRKTQPARDTSLNDADHPPVKHPAKKRHKKKKKFLGIF